MTLTNAIPHCHVARLDFRASLTQLHDGVDNRYTVTFCLFETNRLNTRSMCVSQVAAPLPYSRHCLIIIVTVKCMLEGPLIDMHECNKLQLTNRLLGKILASGLCT